ncbi:MAG: oligoribonuclease [Frankiaceae bacterium]|jgi:oligoribonuclease|nr:oligoribonuclease [Frankiaceae bacterium]MDQ1698177.1 oligoribonuclease [Frankiaceae bacterium]
MTEPLVWIDCEMTGLDPANDVLVEIAIVVTDSDLTLLDDGIDIVIATDPAKLATMDDVVREMHTHSGLLVALESATTTIEEAEQQALDYVRSFVPERRKAPLCGNSIATDRSFIAHYLPQLDDHLHYRMVDVSSIKELSRRWYPRVYFNSPPKLGGHRALADIVDSINELRYYRSTLFVPPPGPDTDAARAAAAQVVPPAPGAVIPD